MVDDLFDVSDDGSAVLRLHVQPGAGRTAVVGRHGDAMKVRVAAPPEGGRANEAVLKLVADIFATKPAAITLVSGEASRSKRVSVKDVEIDEVRRMLELALDDATRGGKR
ncbi:MAG TPA: DUF167 domain-containing protein [Acidimicrobiales bacterium]|nr:DUF167 domain-containing protein [Acidimicrobiales bacterium]